jgi:tetratricopeptide (TPR) repeat protein
MDKQPPQRRRQRPRNHPATIVAVGVLLPCILAVVGYVNYRQWVAPMEPVFPWAQKSVGDAGQLPRLTGFHQSTQTTQSGAMPAPPPKPTAEAIRVWRQIAAQRQSPPQAPRQHNTDDLIAAVDKAFAEPAAELKPAVVFFPVVDGEGKIRPDGVVLGQMATFAATYTPHHRLALSTPFLHDELIVAGCVRPGVRIDPAMIDLCTAALETKLYVLPRLESSDGKGELTVEFHGNGKTYPDRTFQHKLPTEGLNTAPGLVARDVLEALGVVLDAAELQTVLEAQVRSDRELGYLNQVLESYPASGSEDSWLGAFLFAQPHCAFARDQYMMLSHDQEPAAVLKQLADAQAPCDRLQIGAARLLRNSGRAEEALLALLKLAPSHHDDASYQSTLTRCGVALRDERLTNHLLEVWEKAGPGYAGCLERANVLTEWAWEARGGGWASTVTGEGAKLFHERLERARHELELALKRDPSGCRAHVDLMRVARGLGLPLKFMEEHFQDAIRVQPHLLTAYAEKWENLRPRWHGDMEELLAFGKECLDTDAWDDDIPELCASSIMEVGSEASDDSLHLALKAGPFWDLVVAYYQAAEKRAQPAVLARARNIFARLGVLGDHFEEVLPALQKLEETGVLDTAVFPEQGEYDYFCDLVHARTGKLPNRPAGRKRNKALSQASVALAASDIDEADNALAQYERGDAANDRLAERYRGAVALGRKLKTDGKATLSPQQVKDLCVADQESLWTVEGDKLVGKHKAGPGILVLPLGLQNAILSGTLACEGDIYLMQMEIHARSLQHKVRVGFVPGQGQVTLSSDGRALVQAPYQSGSQSFRINLGGDEDRLEPSFGVHWPLPSDDQPGCFALSIWPHVGEATLTVCDLRIELKK